MACSKGDCRLVAVLLATNSCDVTLKTVEGATVLHYFVRKEPQKGRVWGQDSYFVLIKKIVGTNTRFNTHTGIELWVSYWPCGVADCRQRL